MGETGPERVLGGRGGESVIQPPSTGEWRVVYILFPRGIGKACVNLTSCSARRRRREDVRVRILATEREVHCREG